MPMPILAAASIPTSVLITVVVVVLLVFSMILVIVSRFRRLSLRQGDGHLR